MQVFPQDRGDVGKKVFRIKNKKSHSFCQQVYFDRKICETALISEFNIYIYESIYL